MPFSNAHIPQDLFSCQHEKHAYVVAGGMTSSNAALASVEVYLTSKNEWKQIADLTKPRSWYPSMAILGNRLTVSGGQVHHFFSEWMTVLRWPVATYLLHVEHIFRDLTGKEKTQSSTTTRGNGGCQISIYPCRGKIPGVFWFPRVDILTCLAFELCCIKKPWLKYTTLKNLEKT